MGLKLALRCKLLWGDVVPGYLIRSDQHARTSTKQKYVFPCSLTASVSTRIQPKKKIPPMITSTMSAAIRYCLLRTPAVHVAVSRTTARSFTTSQILRRETVTVPKKRPVGAFRGGYVSVGPYWGVVGR